MRLTDGTLPILGFAYLCLPPLLHLRLSVSLKSGGALPQAYSYITRYFQFNATFPATGVSLRTVGLGIQVQVNPQPGVQLCAE